MALRIGGNQLLGKVSTVMGCHHRGGDLPARILVLIEKRAGGQRDDPNLRSPHDHVLDDDRPVILVAAGKDLRTRLATDTASLTDAVKRPSDQPSKKPRLLAF